MGKPQHLHDCEECVFLGTQENYDLYYCSANPTVIARYGSDGDYLSGLILTERIPVLAVAAERAIAAGVLTVEQLQAATKP